MIKQQVYLIIVITADQAADIRHYLLRICFPKSTEVTLWRISHSATLMTLWGLGPDPLFWGQQYELLPGSVSTTNQESIRITYSIHFWDALVGQSDSQKN